MEYTDEQLVRLYQAFSDERDAGFLGPDPDTVREFRKWVAEVDGCECDYLRSYEADMVAEYRAQEEVQHRKDVEWREGMSALADAQRNEAFRANQERSNDALRRRRDERI